VRHLTKRLLAVVIMTLLVPAAQVQAEETESQFKKIEISTGFFGPSFSTNGDKLKKSEVESMVLAVGDEEASGKLKSHRFYHYASLVPSGLGGGLVGYSLGHAAFGGEFPTVAFLSGCGAIGVGFLLDHVANSRLIGSVDRYNEVLEEKYGISLLSAPETSRGFLQISYTF
jgi:hypothetical protein